MNRLREQRDSTTLSCVRDPSYLFIKAAVVYPACGARDCEDCLSSFFPVTYSAGSKFSTDVVRETNIWSGEKTLASSGASTNIHFTNGENDPWAPLSVTEVPPSAARRQSLSSFIVEVRCICPLRCVSVSCMEHLC